MRRWLLLVGLVGCEQPRPADSGVVPAPYTPVVPPAPYAPAVVTPIAPVPAVAADTGAARVERAVQPPKKVNDVWVFEEPGVLLDAYLAKEELGRVRVSGGVGGVIELGGRAGTRLLMGPASRRYLELHFRDQGAEVARKRVSRGSLVTVECTLGEGVGKNARLDDCVLQ